MIPEALASFLSKEIIAIAIALSGLGFAAYVDVTADIAVLQEQEKQDKETQKRIEKKVDDIYKFLLNQAQKKNEG